MKVLIAGGSGFVGRNLLQALPDGWTAVATYHRSEDFCGFLEGLRLPRVEPLRADFRDPRALDAVASRGPFDSCVYLVANSDPAASVTAPADDLLANTLSLVNLLELAEIGRLVFLSSGAVYDGLRGGVSPSSAVSPRLPYAISKLAAEQYVRHFVERGTLSNATIVRFFGAYGPFEPERKIFTRLVRDISLSGRTTFEVRGDGKNLIDAMFVADAVRALLLLMEKGEGCETVDLSCGTPLAIRDLVVAVAAALGREVAIECRGQVPEYIEFFSVDSTLRERYGFETTTSLEEGIRSLQGFLTQRLAADGGGG